MDAGAGTGLVGVELRKFGFTTIDALDISPGMLNEAKKKKVYKRFICASLSDQRIPEVETGEYDVLICVGVFAIAHVPPVALLEMTRMVRPGKMHHSCYIEQFYSNTKSPLIGEVSWDKGEVSWGFWYIMFCKKKMMK